MAKATRGSSDYNPKKSFVENAVPKHFKSVVCLETQKIYCPIKTAKEDGYEPRRISDCCKDNTKTHGGYHWEYYSEDNYEKAI